MSVSALTTVLNQEPRNGSYTSASISLRNQDGTPRLDPGTGQPYTQFVLAGLLSDDDAKNPAYHLRFSPEISQDGGLSYTPLDGALYDWSGGLSPKDGSFERPSSKPPIPTNADGSQPTNFKVTMDTSVSGNINVGLGLGLATS